MPDTPKRPSFFHIFKTAAAAAFGVQSEKNREADFSQNSAIPYIVVGVLFTALLLGVLIGVVSMVV